MSSEQVASVLRQSSMHGQIVKFIVARPVHNTVKDIELVGNESGDLANNLNEPPPILNENSQCFNVRTNQIMDKKVDLQKIIDNELEQSRLAKEATATTKTQEIKQTESTNPEQLTKMDVDMVDENKNIDNNVNDDKNENNNNNNSNKPDTETPISTPTPIRNKLKTIPPPLTLPLSLPPTDTTAISLSPTKPKQQKLEETSITNNDNSNDLIYTIELNRRTLNEEALTLNNEDNTSLNKIIIKLKN